MPWTQTVPVSVRAPWFKQEVGIRVVPSKTLFDAVGNLGQGQSPAFSDLAAIKGEFALKKNKAGWSHALFEVFFNRSAPITAAVSIGLDAPDNADQVLPERLRED